MVNNMPVEELIQEDRQDKIEDAVLYASSSNGLENNVLSIQEMEQVIDGIQQGESDENFVHSVVKLVKTYKPGENSSKEGVLGYGKNR